MTQNWRGRAWARELDQEKAAKMAARMQWANAGNPSANPVLLLVERDAGHGQGKPMSMRIQNLADRWSFIMWTTGLCTGSTP